MVQDLQLGRCSPCSLGIEISWKGGSQYLQHYLLARIRILWRVDYLVSLSYIWASLKWVLNVVHIFCIGRRRCQNLMDSRNSPVLLRMVYALEITWGVNRDIFPCTCTQKGLQYFWKCFQQESQGHSAYLLIIFRNRLNDLVRFSVCWEEFR